MKKNTLLMGTLLAVFLSGSAAASKKEVALIAEKPQ